MGWDGDRTRNPWICSQTHFTDWATWRDSFTGEDFQNICYLHQPCSLAAMCFDWSNLFSYFCRGSPFNHFCKKKNQFWPLVSEENMFKVSHIGHIWKTGYTPWRPCFWRIKFVLAIFVKGNPVIISTKLFWILTTGFRRFLKFALQW